MKMASLKELLSEIEGKDDMEVCVAVHNNDMAGTKRAVGVINLLEQLVYTNPAGEDIIIYDRDHIYYLAGDELEEMKSMKIEINPLGYYSGNPVKKKLVFTY